MILTKKEIQSIPKFNEAFRDAGLFDGRTVYNLDDVVESGLVPNNIIDEMFYTFSNPETKQKWINLLFSVFTNKPSYIPTCLDDTDCKSCSIYTQYILTMIDSLKNDERKEEVKKIFNDYFKVYHTFTLSHHKDMYNKKILEKNTLSNIWHVLSTIVHFIFYIDDNYTYTEPDFKDYLLKLSHWHEYRYDEIKTEIEDLLSEGNINHLHLIILLVGELYKYKTYTDTHSNIINPTILSEHFDIYVHSVTMSLMNKC